MPPSSHTLAAALNGDGVMSVGAAADYGFLAQLYDEQHRSLPNTKQLELLSHTYALALELYGASWLHARLVDRSLRDSLVALTDHTQTFAWVAFLNE